MEKAFIPQIRIISVDHDRTVLAEQRLRHCMDRNGMKEYPVRSVFCHLEAGRCGIPSGIAALEVEGRIIWRGKELTEDLAQKFCEGLPHFIAKLRADMGMD